MISRALESVVLTRGGAVAEAARPDLVATPLLAALRATGTEHVYADTADVEELRELLAAGEGAIRREVDGNTANQPLVRKVVERYLDEGDPRAWARELAARHSGLDRSELLPLLYAILCGRIGNDLAGAFSAGRGWEVSLQLHMGLGARPESARFVGRLLRRAVPSALVKVPFTPDEPSCLLVARDLQREGVPVNLTSTFSARQVVTAALLCDVARTNVFMGRLNQGLDAKLLGEHVDLEAQRALLELRRESGVRTRLIVASVRDWRTFVRVAGCDAFTAPCAVLRDFLAQDELSPGAMEAKLETSYEEDLAVSDDVRRAVGPERIARLYRVEPELVELLRDLRGSPDFARLDGETLRERFDRAGFGDLFHSPTRAERDEMERGKLPRLDGAMVHSAALDTCFSLHANADFARHQREIDAEVDARID